MADLERELRALGADLAVPAGGDLPAAVRDRIAALPVPARDRWWTRFPTGGPARRAVLVAIALILILATVAGAAVLGLPGLRIIFGPAASVAPSVVASPTLAASPAAGPSSGPGSSSPGPSDATLGAGLGLGEPLALEAAHGTVPFAILLPTDVRLGDPEVAWWEPDVGDGQLTILWRATPDLPATQVAGVGALLTETPGTTDDGLIEKSIGPSGTAEPVTVEGQPGYWLTGPPHGFVWWRSVDGEYIEDSRRTVGDTLVWTSDGMLYRLETELGRDAAIEIAESLR